MKKLLNRIKTLYWFWKMTRDFVDEDRWIIETGKYPQGYPRGKKWLEIYTPNDFLTANRDKIK